jgi:hypothetical protein
MALMGRTEFDALQALDDRFHAYADRLGFLYCRDDHWAPVAQHDHFKVRRKSGGHGGCVLYTSVETFGIP